MTGLLLINLGTPTAPTTSAVRRYLREFLSDPHVIDMNPVGRWLLLNLIILPFRPKHSAHAYGQIWSERGSPLLFNSEDLMAAVQQRLGADWTVRLAMRYGEPSIRAGLEALRSAGVDRVLALPLYPQYAMSTTGTTEEAVRRIASELWDDPKITLMEAFYDDPRFQAAFAAVGSPLLDANRHDHVLFSFHGLPERHVRKADPTGSHCLESPDCCAHMVDANRGCYRAQCYATARGIARELGLADDGWSVSFQSRLGRTPWIRPYTDQVIAELVERGVKHLAVYCPAFVADCLETLEEIGIRAAEQFTQSGGESFTLIPSLNSSDGWADTVAALARGATQ